MLLQNKKVAIVGGGPGGLTLARLLQLKGVNVQVYERDINEYARVQGAPLDMHEESGWAALRTANLVEEYKKNVIQGADKKVIVNACAEVFFSDHENKSNEELRSEPPRPEISRGALRKVLLGSLRQETVVWDSQFTSMEKQNEGWQMYFKNGSSVYADFVIAADGGNSKMRPYITEIKAFYSGVTMVEINIDNAEKAAPRIFELMNGGKIMAYGNGRNILGGQKGNGDLGFYASFKPDENWATDGGVDFSDRTQLLTWFKKEYADWSSIWYELFDNAIMPAVPRRIYCMPLDQNWEPLPNLTLLGDAAHVMPPFAGEGANTSMFDALELTECLSSDQYPTLREAIAEYEKSMRHRAAKAAKQSLENGELMHCDGALDKMLQMLSISGRSK
jgi:2-polyprenyl-6-methoxyphenol hydroxylase-like FAD-dependent oxidoreductase